MKELILDLRDSLVALIGALFHFIWDILRVIAFILGYPFAKVYLYLIAPFHILVWYRYHFTQYYQKYISKNTLPRMLKLLRLYRPNRNTSLYVRNERKWAYKIIIRYRKKGHTLGK